MNGPKAMTGRNRRFRMKLSAGKASIRTRSAETPAIYTVWESLVIQHRVSGKTTHDARLVAAMKVHGVTSILTFNTEDFTRYPGIEVVNPADVAAPA